MKKAEAQSAPLIPKTNAGVKYPEEETEELMMALTATSKIRRWLDRMSAEREESILDLWLERLETQDPAIIFPRRT